MGKHSTQQSLWGVGPTLPPPPKPTTRPAAPSKADAPSPPDPRQRSMFHLRVIQAPKNETYERPKTLGECQRIVGDGPCPFVGCRYHTFFETTSGHKSHGRRLAGAIGLRSHRAMRDVSEDELEMAAEQVVSSGREYCSLRIVAENPDGLGRGEVGDHLDMTRERVRQVEEAALPHVEETLAKNDATSPRTSVDRGTPKR